MKQLEPKYNHLAVEEGKYDFWKDAGLFEAGDDSKEPFTIVIPPPNVTGKLHLGHTWDNTLQDIIIRRKRMQGFDALYLPGMDHAGIATQAKVDRKLKEQGIDRYELGREAYLEEAWKWKKEYAKTIRRQWASMGLSLDYGRERFTLDGGLNDAVNEVFVRLYEKGYIYRGERIINWDVEAKTALSNIEIEHKEVEGKLYHYQYPVVGEERALTVATTRPETMFADTALMVHPDDERYLDIHGKNVRIPTTDRIIPVITDEYVDPSFGSGIVKVTPAHDPNDFEVGQRHDLDMPLCMDEDGTMNEMAGRYAGMERFACRKALVSDLEEEGLLVDIEDHVHSVGHSERTGVIVEPRKSKQWFVRMENLADQAMEQSTVQFIPDRFKKIFNNWMNNIEDWCISRQLWWGHRIPVWYKDDEIYCGKEAPEGDGWVQDTDVLDTWFSSALWPFSTLGWPEETKDYQRYYPNDVMVTGYDIIFFWVARMIFQGIEFTGETPFSDCLIHGLIRDENGIKMSKSLGNGVDPIDVVEEFGADSLRYFISTNSAPGLDLRYEREKVESAWNFINKLWNISRYFLMNTRPITSEELEESFEPSTFANRWILNRLNATIHDVDRLMDAYEFGEAAKTLHQFAWNDFASWYLEMHKILPSSRENDRTALTVLSAIVRMLHPYMPFVTEEIYQMLPHDDVSVMVAAWPEASGHQYPDAEGRDEFFDLIRKVRSLRNEYNVPYKQPIDILIETSDDDLSRFLGENRVFVESFLNPGRFEIASDIQTEGEVIPIVFPTMTCFVPLGDLVDIDAEIQRLEKELASLNRELKRSENMLNNENFLNKAPASKVKEERRKYETYKKKHAETSSRLASLKDGHVH